MTATISPIPAFNDNYIWMLENSSHNRVAVVDPGDATPVLKVLTERNLELSAILITHHHWDHTGGIDTLLNKWSVPVYGPKSDQIPQVTTPLQEGDKIDLDGLSFSVLAVPGHTLDHIAYFASPEQSMPILFCGDTLFAAGCGRLFEGTPEQLYSSLYRLSQLPANTQVFCTHEYTQANLTFASEIEPENAMLADRVAEAALLRHQGKPTLPTSIGLEKQTNPFLRCSEPTVCNSVSRHSGQQLRDPVSTFALLRKWKDVFVI